MLPEDWDKRDLSQRRDYIHGNNLKRFVESIDYIDLKSCLPDKQQLLSQLGCTNMEIGKQERLKIF